MASDNVEFTRLSTEEPAEYTFTPSSPSLSSPPSFLVPSSTSIPPSPLVIPAHSLPLHVSSSILNTLGKEVQTTQEHVIYCEAPRKCNGFKSGRFIFIVSLYLLITTIILSMQIFKKEKDTALSYAHGYGEDNHFSKWWILLFSIPTLFLAVLSARFQFFGYRVVTNHRAAVVIPRRHMIVFPSTSNSAYFKPAMDKLMEGTLRENRCTLANKLAALYYRENKIGGQAVIYGDKVVDFGFVSDLKLLDDALSGAIHATATYSGIKLGSDLKLREEGSYASPHLEQLRFRTELFLLFVVPFLLGSGLLSLYVLQVLSIFSCKVLLASLLYSLYLVPTLIAVGKQLRSQRLSIESKRSVFIGSHSSPFWA